MRAWNDTWAVPPAGSDRPRSWIEDPTIVAVPVGVGAAVTPMSETPAGAMRFADPSCCVPVSFTRVNVSVRVDPAGRGWGETSAAYGLDVLSANAGIAIATTAANVTAMI